MDALTQLVLLITLAAVALYALYWTVRRAIRDELASLGGRDDLPSGGPGR